MLKNPKVIIMIELQTKFGRDLMRGIAKYIHLHGPWTTYGMPTFYLHPNWGKSNVDIARFKKLQANGIITRAIEAVDKIVEMGLDIIIADDSCPMGNLPRIITDHQKTGEMAAEHFLDKGFKQFAYCGFDGLYWSDRRGQSFAKTVNQAGYEVMFYRQPKSKAKRMWENEQPILADWLKKLPKPIGLMACADYRGQHVIDACSIAGLHVPEEIAVIGVDNDDLICRLCDPPLSSIAFNTEQTGYKAAQLLDALMSGEKMAAQTIMIHPTHVVTRQSTDILAIEDSDVAAAMHFIKTNAKTMIQVDDVSAATGVSRRSLERRFRDVLGRSVYNEIRRVRMEKVARMLVETNVTVSKIAPELGFISVDNMSQCFQREKGMSPLAFRRAYGNQ